MNHHVLDARRLLCPLPVIRTQDAIRGLHSGDHLQVICTDPGAIHDIPAWCRVNGHQVLETHTTDEQIVLIIEVGETS